MKGLRPLALLRIAVAIVALVSPEPAIARIVAERPRALWTVPEGLGWLGSIVPLDATLVTIATALLRASAVLAILGFHRRLALSVLALALLYVFGAAQLTGTVTHDMHLFWFAALLACVKDRDERDPRVLLVARLWLGLVYFFPGVHKLAAHGGSFAWITSDNLRNQMYFKWYEAGGVAPWPRIDLVPHLLNVVAAGVILFELAMPVLVSFRRTRLVALVLGVLFHLCAGRFLDVLFPSLLACYVVLLPERAHAPMRNRARSIVSATFTAAIVFAGVRGQTQAYPFACYPTFATLAGDEIVDLAVEDGDRMLRLPRVRRPDEWGLVWRLAGLYGERVDPERLAAFARNLGARDGAVVWAEAHDVRPEAWGTPPKRRWRLSPAE